MTPQSATIPQKRIAVAMSGGVDSSVTAALLKKEGCAVTGLFMALAQPDLDRQVDRVRGVADFLGIDLEVVDLAASFEKEVLEYFTRCYYDGQTPNPCVVCNRRIKFGRLLEYALDLGAEALATGHYAGIVRDPEGECHLRRGRDPKKDQSYFLCHLRQEQLQRIRFPLGEYTKTAVYDLARVLGLAGRHGDESQDVCFLQHRSVEEFLRGRGGRETTSGAIVTLAGREIGRHRGIQNYTVGQRRGLGIPDLTPYYVVGLDPGRNQVVVGKKADLWHDVLLAREVSWTSGRTPALPARFLVKIRYRHQAAEAVVEKAGSMVRVRFAEPQRAITPGQYVAFYRGDEVAGGGEIVGADAGAGESSQ